VKHELKTWLEPFRAIVDGSKRHEYRKEIDRTFRVGDTLFLREWDETRKIYTGRAIEVRVTYLARGPDFDIPKDAAVMSIVVVSELVEGTFPPGQDDPVVTKDLLSLASVDMPIDVVASWSPDERKQADDWASWHCLHASGQDVPPMPVPSHVERFVRREDRT